MSRVIVIVAAGCSMFALLPELMLLQLPIDQIVANSDIERLKYLRSLYENGNKLLTDVTQVIDDYITNPCVENGRKIRKAIELAQLMDVD